MSQKGLYIFVIVVYTNFNIESSSFMLGVMQQDNLMTA